MGIRKKETGANNLPVRNAADFYLIPLQADYTLTWETLEIYTDKKMFKEARWFYPELTLQSFEDSVGVIASKSEKAIFNISIKVEPANLQVSCNCGMQVETLCLHAAQVLYRLSLYNDAGNLKEFMPNSTAQIAVENRSYFESKPGLRNMLQPKAALGNVYGINDEMADYSIADVLALPAQVPAKTAIKETEMCYMIMYSRRNDFLPFLLPCAGKLTKAGDRIKGFDNFLSGFQKEYDALLTEEQRTLNNIALDINKLVAKLPHELIHEAMSYDEPDDLLHVFNLWQKAMPLLEKQQCYLYPYFHKRYLKGKPWRSYLEKINVRQADTAIQFKLTDKGAFYQLEMKPVINGKTISRYDVPDSFFIGERGTMYMLASVRDAAIVEWMEKSGNKITVFKKQFAQFEKDFLQPLEKYYLIKR